MSHVIGIDVGSQSIKAVCLDESGTVVGTSRAFLTTAHPYNGWAEQSPLDWTRQLTHVVRTLLADLDVEVSHLALASQVDGVVAVDSALAPLHPALIWLDRRATAQTSALVEGYGELAVFERTGLNADASHGAPKMMWLRDNQPEVWRATRWLLPVGGYLLAWLTGQVVQDATNASSTMLFDLKSGEYSDLLCQCAGISPDQLPPLAAATEVVGTITASVADELGLSRGCRVTVGTGDEHAAALAAGVFSSDVIADVAGTAEPVLTIVRDFVLDDSRLLETHGHAAPDTFMIENPGFVAGGSTLWFAAQVLGIAQADLFPLAAQAPPGSDGVVFVPALTGSTTPRWNGDVRGSFAGLSLNHSRAHFARAVLEGCAYALRDIVDHLVTMGFGGREIRTIGGGSRSPLWNQIKAGVLGRPLRLVDSADGSAVGAAMIAAVAAGSFTDLPSAAESCVALAADHVVPNTADHDAYEQGYQSYRRLFTGLESAL